MSELEAPDYPLTIELAMALHEPFVREQKEALHAMEERDKKELIKKCNEEIIFLMPKLLESKQPISFSQRYSATQQAREQVFSMFKEMGVNIEVAEGGSYDGVHFCWLETNYKRPESGTIREIITKLWGP